MGEDRKRPPHGQPDAIDPKRPQLLCYAWRPVPCSGAAMRRREFIGLKPREDEMRLRILRADRIGPLSAPLVAAVLLFGSPSFAPAQTERLPKVGYLGFGASVPPTLFQNRMRELRFSEGKEVAVEYRFAGGHPGELPRLARELVDAKVDVIMALGDEAIVAAKNATRTVPIVMIACDAVTTGFVVSLARPGGNLTGVTCLTSELMPKRIAGVRDLRPAALRLVGRD